MGLSSFNRRRRMLEAAKSEVEEQTPDIDVELGEMRLAAKELGIKNWHNMGKEKLTKKLEEAEVSASGQTKQGDSSGSQVEGEQEQTEKEAEADQE